LDGGEVGLLTCGELVAGFDLGCLRR
jgi:hypothetical protein